MKRIILFILFLLSCSQSPEYYLKRGNSFFISGDYYRAIDMYTLAILKKTDYADAYVSRAMAYEKIGNKIKATDDYLKAITYNPKYLAAYNNLASLYIESSLYDKALYYIEKSLEINPSYKYAYYNRGIVNYFTNKYQDAIRDFTKAIELSSSDMPLAYYYRALAYNKLSMNDEAIKDLNYIVDKGNANDVIYYTIARILLDSNPELAIGNINKALEIKQEHSYYYLRAKINDKLGKIVNAIDDINNAIKISNLSKVTYFYYAADLYIKIFEYSTAEKYCSMALDINPSSKNEYDLRIKVIKKAVRKKR